MAETVLCTPELKGIPGAVYTPATNPSNYPYWVTVTVPQQLVYTRQRQGAFVGVADVFIYSSLSVEGVPISKGTSTTASDGKTTLTLVTGTATTTYNGTFDVPTKTMRFTPTAGGDALTWSTLFDSVISGNCSGVVCSPCAVFSTGAIVIIVILAILFLIALILFIAAAASLSKCRSQASVYRGGGGFSPYMGYPQQM